jgi:hypothetical protein
MTVRLGSRFWLAAVAALTITAQPHAQAPATAGGAPRSAPAAAALAWPQSAVADPARLGFSKAGLDALDARMKQAVDAGRHGGHDDHSCSATVRLPTSRASANRLPTSR